MFPKIALPPRPVITRWGTWIVAAVYFAVNFEAIVAVFDRMDPKDDAKCVLKAKAALRAPNIKADLAFIKSHFESIPVTITKLEAQGVLLSEAISTFKSVRTNLAAIPRRAEFLKKFDYVYGKNKGLHTLEQVGRLLDGETVNTPNKYIDQLTPVEIAAFKYAPITSCDVERSFSAYNRVLEDCRRAFVFENLKKHVVIHCNKLD